MKQQSLIYPFAQLALVLIIQQSERNHAAGQHPTDHNLTFVFSLLILNLLQVKLTYLAHFLLGFPVPLTWFDIMQPRLACRSQVEVLQTVLLPVHLAGERLEEGQKHTLCHCIALFSVAIILCTYAHTHTFQPMGTNYHTLLRDFRAPESLIGTTMLLYNSGRTALRYLFFSLFNISYLLTSQTKL